MGASGCIVATGLGNDTTKPQASSTARKGTWSVGLIA
jgi:hypothetical protein